ncbi:MAG: hypothetical protein H0V48_06560 [Nocardioidaceae bacterium]|nr:hypothetical protein [Nocardioidaceae bacterium]
MLLAFTTLGALVATAVGCALRPLQWLLFALLLLLSGVWLIVNHPVEGAVLLVVSAEHGLTVADLAVPLVWSAVGVAWLRRR